jgi:hypothetical protein
MEQTAFEAGVESTRELYLDRAKPIELQIWLELPLGSAGYPIRRKPSLALSLARSAPGEGVGAPKVRAPTHHLDAASLGIVAAFLGVLWLGVLGRGLAAILWWL